MRNTDTQRYKLQLRTRNSRTSDPHLPWNTQSLIHGIRGRHGSDHHAVLGSLQVRSLVREAGVRPLQRVFGSLIEGSGGGSLFLFVTNEGEQLTIFVKSTDVVQLRAFPEEHSEVVAAEIKLVLSVSEPEGGSEFYERTMPVFGLLVQDAEHLPRDA